MQRESSPLYPSIPIPTIQKNGSVMSVPPTSIAGPPPHQPVLLGPSNTKTTCQFCHASVNTSVKYTATTRTHVAALLCSFCCCCCIPYCSASGKNSDHYCPNCHKFLGTYEK